MTAPVYDYICSIGELIDKLTIENIKCHYVNHEVLVERKKEHPDSCRIAELEARARASGEQRVRLKDEINRRLAEAIARGEIGTPTEARTYGA